MKIAVLKETAEGERRVAASAETVKKFIGLGASVAVESGAGVTASVSDADFEAAGASVGSRADVLKDADILLGVAGPTSVTEGRQEGRLAGCGAQSVRRTGACR